MLWLESPCCLLSCFSLPEASLPCFGVSIIYVYIPHTGLSDVLTGPVEPMECGSIAMVTSLLLRRVLLLSYYINLSSTHFIPSSKLVLQFVVFYAIRSDA